jgi:hypothetical protein
MATSPNDLKGYYLTAGLGFAPVRSIASIDKRLALMPLNDVLIVLAQIAQRADLAGSDLTPNIELARSILPAKAAERAASHLSAHSEACLVSAQAVMNLALRALVVSDRAGAPVTSPTARNRLRTTLGELLLACGDHLGDGPDTTESMTVELLRLGLFFATHDHGAWLEIASPMFFEVLPTLKSHPDWVDVDDVLRKAFGLDFERFWSLTAILGMAMMQSHEHVRVPPDIDNLGLDEDIVKWINAWSIGIDDARENATLDLALGNGWRLSAFHDRPLIALDDHSHISVRPSLVARKAAPAGMFWAIRHAYVAQGGDHERWSRLFGVIVETYGHELLAQHFPVENIRLEGTIREWGSPQQCDAIIDLHSLIAVDFVYRQFTLPSAATGNFTDLTLDLRRAVVEKLVQIDQSLRTGLQKGFLTPGEMYPIVVIGAPFPVEPLIYSAIEAELVKTNLQVIGVDPRCKPFSILSLDQFRSLLVTARDIQVPPQDLLRDWLASPLGTSNFRDWLTTDGPGPSADALGKTWSERAKSNLYIGPSQTPEFSATGPTSLSRAIE